MNCRNSRQVSAPPLSRSQIIEMAESLSIEYATTVDHDLALLSIGFDAIYDNVIYPQYEIALDESRDLGFDEAGYKILGEYNPFDNIAYIDPTIGPTTRDNRRVFTLWHEVAGHGVLQGEWLRSEFRKQNRNSFIITTEQSLDLNTINELERQANLFASYAAAPTWYLLYAIREALYLPRPIRFTGPGRYCLSLRNDLSTHYEIKSFNELCRIIAYKIKWRFGGLSVEALSYRIEKLESIFELHLPAIRLKRSHRPTASHKFGLHGMQISRHLAVG